jgi:predicted Zn finger-like uncharacterized protein
MYTECPQCHAIFRVTQEILQAAAGKVRCGECSTVFQAVKPQKPEATATSTDNSVLQSKTIERKKPRQVKKPASVDRRGSSQQRPVASTSSFHRHDEYDKPDAEEKPADTEFAPKYLPIPVAPQRLKLKRKRPVWVIPVLAILGLLLVGQALTANRKYLGSKPFFRPVVTAVCKVSGCEVPVHKNLDAIELLNHGVFSHPTVPGALMIKGMIQNKANFEQPYPVIELGFSDIRGKPVAMRRFGPNEYLDLRKEHPEKMPIGKNIPIRVEVIDPGKNALAFEFDFL